jgi:CRP/FNR family transcriptional regulator, cyclic AMP receptor protein
LAALSDLDQPRWKRSETTPASVLVLEADPDLGSGIDKVQWQLAVAASLAPAFELDRGPWRFAPRPDPGAFGALLLDGLIVIRINAETRAHVELLGPGDVIGPWVGSGQELTLPSVPTTSVVSKARIALLDRRFAVRTARWPEIHAAIMHRMILRTRRLSLQSAINGLSRIEERLEVTLWELAYRFGRVTPDGIMLDLPLTHSQMAEMVAAQRPSVSTAFTRLQDHGRIVHAARHRWLLLGEPPSTLAALAQQSGLAP